MHLQPIHTPFRSTSPRRRLSASVVRRGFSLMELMVAVSILVVIILSVNVTFSGASRAVSTSQATMDVMASERGIQQMLECDLSGLDRNGFLVIRCRVNNANSEADRSYRFDQISFLANGEFANPSGADAANPFTDSTTSNAAHIWIGQLVMEKNGGGPSYLQPNQAGTAPDGQRQLPTGAWVVNGAPQIQESAFVLGRHVSMLVPGPTVGNRVSPAGRPIMAYQNLSVTNGAISGVEGPAHITSSRYSVVAQTPAQVMSLAASLRSGGEPNPEAYLFTSRFRALQSVYDTEVSVNPFVNGYYRASPMVLAGVSSFRVEWTDGKVYPMSGRDENGRVVPSALIGQVRWYGPQGPKDYVTNQVQSVPLCSLGVNMPDPQIEQVNNTVGNDNYVATFSYFNKTKWPKALRFTIHVVNERLNGGRDFVHVVNLPQ